MHEHDVRVLAVALDSEHSFSKPLKQRITLIANHGVEGDAHAGAYTRHRFLARAWPKQPNRRQVHLVRAELLDELRKAGHLVGPGDLGENVTTTGIKLEHLPLRTKVHLGRSAVVELTGLRTPCMQIDRFQKGLRNKMVRSHIGGPKFKCGVFCVVLVGGDVSPGDPAEVEIPAEPYAPLPAL